MKGFGKQIGKVADGLANYMYELLGMLHEPYAFHQLSD